MTFNRTWTKPPKLRDRPPAEPSAQPVRRGTYSARTEVVAVPKTVPKRSRALLDMANGRRCLLIVPDVCIGGTDSTVACHSNLGVHGKAGARKADDQYSVWGCRVCHAWLDQGGADAGVKLSIFMLAHFDQVGQWRVIASDQSEPERFRKAAQWALDQLGATPVGVAT